MLVAHQQAAGLNQLENEGSSSDIFFSRFEINLKNYQDDFLLHFNPRFDDNILVLNSGT